MGHARDITSGSAMIRRAFAFAAVVGLLLQGTSGGHMLLVEHTRCAEHGELVHTEDVHHHAESEVAPVAVLAFDDAGKAPSEAAHEHCNHSAEHRDAANSIADAAALDFAPVRDVVARPDAPQGVASAPVYHDAPKNSPPA